ncbi:MAG TPA: SpoIVB peptidase S55 domain-containing protein [Candidatus Binatia bacterium]|nr:SpoIVB peptidase S55 domain-containing protein [Candidatus Binatia bacterium]
MKEAPSGFEAPRGARGATRALAAVAALMVAAAAPETKPAAIPMLPLDQIHAGMMGVAKTVFEGSNLEEFKVEILGVMKNAVGPQQDLILARLHGDKVEYTGVVSGMSGSPVYVDGKLIGAVSYRLGSFAKEPIAGITPIADMLRLAGPGRAAAGTRAPDLLGRFMASQAGVDSALAETNPEATAMVAGGGAPDVGALLGGVLPGGPLGGLQPIGVPLVCSGCDAGVLRYYMPIFESSGLEPTAGGGMTTGRSDLPLLPGTAIGGALATGDLSVVGIGTLTHIDGNRVFAFGHPLLGTGALEMPMTQAEVLITFASSAASFKIANSTPPVGTIFQDGLTAIVGEVGRPTPMIPVTVKIASHGATRVFHYDILRNRAWSPVVLALTTANSLTRTTEFDASDTLAMRCRIAVDGYPPVVYEDLYSSTSPAQPVHTLLANDAASLFNLLYNNRFEEARVRSADLEVDVLETSKVATMTSLRAARTEVRPGESLSVTAVLSLYRGRTWEETWNVVLPEDMRPGDTEIVVGSGPAIDSLDRRMLERQVVQAASLGDLVRLASRQRRARTLYLRMTRRAPTAVVRSEILPDLPLSIFSVFNNPRLSADTTLMGEAPILELPKDLDVVVAGGRRISIRVK